MKLLSVRMFNRWYYAMQGISAVNHKECITKGSTITHLSWLSHGAHGSWSTLPLRRCFHSRVPRESVWDTFSLPVSLSSLELGWEFQEIILNSLNSLISVCWQHLPSSGWWSNVWTEPIAEVTCGTLNNNSKRDQWKLYTGVGGLAGEQVFKSLLNYCDCLIGSPWH